ncbi:MAG: polysaccharide pyruvyl transferase family protein [Eubacteriales bacterium]|nr:polysaccharide pyruvyl transferase family protein [Eubacteriales bacterium]
MNTETATIRKVLLMGYNGANNTGSEARLLAIMKEVRDVLGPEAEITIPTICGENLRRYVKEEPNLRIVEYPTVYFLALYRLVKEHDLILLTEGSCYMDTWSSCLLWAWLWVTGCASRKGKTIVAYAVDSGDLSPFNQKLVRYIASKTDLIITRTRVAADRLKTWKVSAPIEATADSAFDFCPNPADGDILKKSWPEAASGVIGIAAVDFYLWPVVFRPFGRSENCYRWPYYYSDSHHRRDGRKTLAVNYARFADRMIEEHGRPIVLICMEQLDEPLAGRILSSMRHKDKVRIFSSREYNTSQMTSILRSLDLLVTSRYHAGVLSLDAAVPQIAIGHDQRLRDLYRELELFDDYFLEYTSPQLFQMLEERAGILIKDGDSQREILRKNSQKQHMRANRNPLLLKRLLNGEVIR